MGAGPAIAEVGVAIRNIEKLPNQIALLFAGALRLIREIDENGIKDPFWTFGGGTVLMLRHGHRKSKDVDIFVPDAQYLGYVNPARSAVAESISRDYFESAGHVKLVLAGGEIDFVAAPNLTVQPFELWDIAGIPVRVETAAEIVAKKMLHRGDKATARDLFDLAMVAELAPEQIAIAAPHMARHAAAFIEQVTTRRRVLETQFNAIDVIGYSRSYDQCLEIAFRALGQFPRQSKAPNSRLKI